MPEVDPQVVQELLDARGDVLRRHLSAYREWRWVPTMSNAIRRDKLRYEVGLFGPTALSLMHRHEQKVEGEYAKRGETP